MKRPNFTGYFKFLLFFFVYYKPVIIAYLWWCNASVLGFKLPFLFHTSWFTRTYLNKISNFIFEIFEYKAKFRKFIQESLILTEPNKLHL
jgi:hypothetical protein